MMPSATVRQGCPAIGVDLGGTNIKSAVVTAKGEVRNHLSIPAKVDLGPDAVADRIAEAVRRVLDAAGLGPDEVAGVGLGSPGGVNPERGRVMCAANMPGWKDVPIVAMLEERLRLPVRLENDANAACYGEYWAGAGRGTSSMVILTLGTGIGGGIIVDGSIVRGANNIGGELGHTVIEYDGVECACGNTGCLEAYASANATVRRFIEAVESGQPSSLAERFVEGERISARDIYTAARAGDELSRLTLIRTGEFLGIGISNIVHALDPEMVVLVGGLVGAAEYLLEGIWKELPKRVFGLSDRKFDVRTGELGDDAGVVGAAGCLLKRLETSA